MRVAWALIIWIKGIRPSHEANVLLFIGSFDQGGSERQAVQLARLLHESERYDLRIACLDGRGVLRAEVEKLGLGEMPEFKLSSFYDLNMAWQLHRAARFMRERPSSTLRRLRVQGEGRRE